MFVWREAILGFWKGLLSWEWGHCLLGVARGTTIPSLWRFIVVDSEGCGSMPLLDHGQHQNCEGANSYVGVLSILFVWLVNLQCVQQFGSSIQGLQLLQVLRVASSRIKHGGWFMLALEPIISGLTILWIIWWQ